MPFPMVFFQIAERGPDAALGGTGVRARWGELGDDSNVRAAAGIKSSHQARAPCANDECVKNVCFHTTTFRLIRDKAAQGIAAGSKSEIPMVAQITVARTNNARRPPMSRRRPGLCT